MHTKIISSNLGVYKLWLIAKRNTRNMSIGNIEVINQTNQVNTGTVIILHGSGDTGQGIKSWIEFLKKDAAFPHLKIIFPTAPLMKYTAADGEMRNVWFNRIHVTQQSPEVTESVDKMAQQLVKLIDKEVDSGIPRSRIIIGGFSMGGAMAMHIAFRYAKDLAGVFALSSFLNDKSQVYTELRKSSDEVPALFQTHGDRDDLVPLDSAKETHENLLNCTVKGEFHVLRKMHELTKKEINLLYDWINKKIPDTS